MRGCIGGGEVAVGVGIDGGSVLGRVGVRGRWKECIGSRGRSRSRVRVTSRLEVELGLVKG